MSLLRTTRPSRFRMSSVADDSEAAGTVAVVAVEVLAVLVTTITTAAAPATTAPLRPRSSADSSVAHKVLTALHPPFLPSSRDCLGLVRMAPVRMAPVLTDTLTTRLLHHLPTAATGLEQVPRSTSGPGLPH